jgi:type I restriction-modification system DNA methylase subunit
VDLNKIIKMSSTNNNNFSELSKSITKKITLKQKSNEGIFFTPSSIINKTINILLNIENINIKNILEPSCGSCEFIYKLNNIYKDKVAPNVFFENVSYITTFVPYTLT